jgi:hypothetical protein
MPSRARADGCSSGPRVLHLCGRTSRPRGRGPWTGLGLAGIHIHDLRHAGNHFAAMTGASTRELMGREGHASMDAALIYQHRTADRDRAIACDRRHADHARCRLQDRARILSAGAAREQGTAGCAWRGAPKRGALREPRRRNWRRGEAAPLIFLEGDPATHLRSLEDGSPASGLAARNAAYSDIGQWLCPDRYPLRCVLVTCLPK